MIEARDVTTDEEIDAAIEAAKLLEDEPLARIVEHDRALNVLVISLNNGRRLVIPVEDLQGLTGATHDQLQDWELHGQGTGIGFPQLDADFYVPSLIQGIYGTRKWMERIGRKIAA